MASHRPYHVALSEHEALAELERFASTQFDRTVVALLAARVEERLRTSETAEISLM
jgi:HD-GYP domain-containing protein (c-di-GMP phosphodiesterase class II)